jgi:hypothetical protein
MPACAGPAGPAWPLSEPHNPIVIGLQAEFGPIANFSSSNHFQIHLNAKNSFQHQKSVETCTKTQKCKINFYGVLAHIST